MVDAFQLLQAIGGLAGVAAMIMVWVVFRKNRDESRRGVRQDYRDEADRSRGRLREAEAQAVDYRERIEVKGEDLMMVRKENTELRARLEVLERALPLALVAPRLVEPVAEGLAQALDHIRDLVAVRSPSDGGTFLWVNAAWTDALGYDREALLGRPWAELVHPDDIAATKKSEAAAWVVETEGLVNRYKSATGSWVLLRWVATSYKGGVSFGVARVENEM